MNTSKVILIIIITFFLQNCSNDYTAAEKFAQNGEYKSFYSKIEKKLKKGDLKAKNLLIDYCFKAIKDGDLEQVQYYMQHEPKLVDAIDSEGNRAIDVVFFNEKINLKMLKLLLQFKPQLNYIVHYYDMTPLQIVVSGKSDNIAILKLLLSHGADVNFIGKSNYSKGTALILSYVRDKIKVFSLLLKSGANYAMPDNNIYDVITGSYGLYLQNHDVDLHGFYHNNLSLKIRSILHTYGYKIVHEKNMQYLKLLQQHIKQTQEVSCAPKKLIKWYIKTQENKALQSLMCHHICKKVIDEMKEFAIAVNNRPALYILNQQKNEIKW